MKAIRFFKHTAKAVRANSATVVAPADRVFVAVGPFKSPKILAWKMTAAPGGVSFAVACPPGTTPWTPPTVKTATNMNELRQLIADAEKGGSEPSAVFRLDSFYQELTEAEVFA